MRRATSLAVTGLFACALAAGCAKKNQQQPYAPGTYGQQPGTYGQQPGTYGQQPGTYPPGTTAQPAPTTTAQPPPAATGTAPPAAAGGQCQPIDAAAAAPAAPLIQAVAASDVPPGAKPLGALVAGNCQAGQSLESQIQMQPGKCYTVVGAGAGVSELDLQIVPVSPIPGVAPVLAQDNQTGPQAVIGKRPDCWKWAWPIGGSVKLIVKATAGSGIVGAQVFEK